MKLDHLSNPKVFNSIYTKICFPKKEKLVFSIYYHKGKPNVKFQVDMENKLIKNNDIQVRMFRNLDNCMFTNSFLNLKDVSKLKVDARNQFCGVTNFGKKKIFKINDEKIDLEYSKHKNVNDLRIIGWKLYGTDQDYLFYLIERSLYNKNVGKVLVRTSAIQFSTESSLDVLEKYYDKSLAINKKSDNSNISVDDDWINNNQKSNTQLI